MKKRVQGKTAIPQPGGPHKAARRNESSLSPQWAFVVQLRSDTDIEAGRLAGRVEHVVSGQATHFSSLEDLLAFIGRVLAGLHTEPTEET